MLDKDDMTVWHRYNENETEQAHRHLSCGVCVMTVDLWHCSWRLYSVIHLWDKSRPCDRVGNTDRCKHAYSVIHCAVHLLSHCV